MHIILEAGNRRGINQGISEPGPGDVVNRAGGHSPMQELHNRILLSIELIAFLLANILNHRHPNNGGQNTLRQLARRLLGFSLCPFPDESTDVNQSWCQSIQPFPHNFKCLTPKTPQVPPLCLEGQFVWRTFIPKWFCRCVPNLVPIDPAV